MREKLIEYETLAALGRLTANVAHEIRNPITVIGGLTERLKKNFVHEPKQKEYLDLISLEVKKLEVILKDVLIFSNKAVFKREIQDIHKIINDSLNTYQDKCPTFKVEVQQKQKRPQAVFCSPGISWACC
jgi:signal transduction histidine kinase